MTETLGFKLDRWTREARELATCVSCYGVGESRDAPGRACETCDGRGRAAREPHVLELVAIVRDRDAGLDELQRDVTEHRSMLSRVRALLRDEEEERAKEVAFYRGETAASSARIEALDSELDEARQEIDRLRGALYQERARRLRGGEE